MIEMDVVGVRIELPSNQPLVLLKESAGTRHIPIWIGAPEASAIAFVQQGIVPPRPMTHDLLVSMVAAQNHTVTEVRIVRVEDTVFHAEVVYGGLVQVSNVPKEAMEQVLLIECPRFLFPFARRIIADLTAEGGFPPLQLDPIDFAAVYEARRHQVENTAGNA